MKNQLLTLAAAMLLGTGAFTASAETGTVFAGTGSNYEWPGGQMYNKCASESLYPASLMEAATNGADSYTITEISLPLSGTKPTSGVVTFDVYAMPTTDNALYAAVAFDQMAEVATQYNVDFATIEGNAIKITLSTPITMSKGQGLILGLETSKEEDAVNGTIEFSCGYPDGINGPFSWYSDAAWTAWFNNDLSGYGGDKLNSLDITYTAAGGGEEAEPVTVDLTKGAAANWNYPMGSMYWNYCISEALYPATLFETATEGKEAFEITELFIPYNGMTINSGDIPVKGISTYTIYALKTTDTTLTSAVSLDEMSLVGTVNVDYATQPDPNGVTLPLSTPIQMEKGKGLILGFMTYKPNDNEANYPAKQLYNKCIDVQFNNAYLYSDAGIEDGAVLAWYDNTQDANAKVPTTSASQNCVLGIQMTYKEVQASEPAAPVELEAVSVEGPEEVFTGIEYDYTLTVKNNGSENASVYKVELINLADNDAVLDTVEDAGNIIAGMSKKFTFSVMFNNAATYQLAARVTIEGDANTENNTSVPYEVVVKTLPYKATALTGEASIMYDVETAYTVNVLNQSDADLTGYTVKLVNVKDNGSENDEEVLATIDGETLAAGASKDYVFNRTFNLCGNYTLKGVVESGDLPISETNVIEVTVGYDKQTTAAEPEVVEGIDNPVNYFGSPLFANDEGNANFNQILYPASKFSEVRGSKQIQTISFTVPYNYDPEKSSPIKVYMAAVDRTDSYSADASLVPADAFELVYDGEYTVKYAEKIDDADNPQKVTLVLQRPFVLENGKSLVLNVNSVGTPGGYGYALDCQFTDEAYWRYYAGQKVEGYDDIYSLVDYLKSAYKYNSAISASSFCVPSFEFEYGIIAPPASVDMEVTSFEITKPADATEVAQNDEVSFKVGLKNNGTVEMEEFTIELLNVADAADPVVLESFENRMPLAAEAAGTQTIKYVFENEGDYSLSVRVVAAEDTDESNNTWSTPIALKVTGSVGVDTMIAEGTMAFDHNTKVLTVNAGAGRLTVVDAAGRVVATANVEGAAQIELPLAAGIYVINLNGKSLKVRI